MKSRPRLKTYIQALDCQGAEKFYYATLLVAWFGFIWLKKIFKPKAKPSPFALKALAMVHKGTVAKYHFCQFLINSAVNFSLEFAVILRLRLHSSLKFSLEFLKNYSKSTFGNSPKKKTRISPDSLALIKASAKLKKQTEARIFGFITKPLTLPLPDGFCVKFLRSQAQFAAEVSFSLHLRLSLVLFKEKLQATYQTVQWQTILFVKNTLLPQTEQLIITGFKKVSASAVLLGLLLNRLAILTLKLALLLGNKLSANVLAELLVAQSFLTLLRFYLKFRTIYYLLVIFDYFEEVIKPLILFSSKAVFKFLQWNTFQVISTTFYIVHVYLPKIWGKTRHTATESSLKLWKLGSEAFFILREKISLVVLYGKFFSETILGMFLGIINKLYFFTNEFLQDSAWGIIQFSRFCDYTYRVVLPEKNYKALTWVKHELLSLYSSTRIIIARLFTTAKTEALKISNVSKEWIVSSGSYLKFRAIYYLLTALDYFKEVIKPLIVFLLKAVFKFLQWSTFQAISATFYIKNVYLPKIWGKTRHTATESCLKLWKLGSEACSYAYYILAVWSRKIYFKSRESLIKFNSFILLSFYTPQLGLLRRSFSEGQAAGWFITKTLGAILAVIFGTIDNFIVNPAASMLSRHFSPLKKALAVASICLLLSGNILPAVASTIEFTDRDIQPNLPVLQQEVTVIGNEGSNLLAVVEKKQELIPNPIILRSQRNVETSTDPPPESNTSSSSDPPNPPVVLNQVLELPAPIECVSDPSASDQASVVDDTGTDPPDIVTESSPPPEVEPSSIPENSADSTAESLGTEVESQALPEPTSLEAIPDEPGACAPTEESGASSQQLNTSDGSLIDTKQTIKNLVEIVNTNSIKVVNEVKSESLTGQNSIISGDSGQDALIDTGNINVFANVLNVVNTNLHNSKIVEIAETFNSLSADVLLNHPETQASEITSDLVKQICTSLECSTLNSFTLTNKNYAEVENNIDVLGHSGQNLMQNIEERGLIRSGNVNALVNVLNIVNSNLLNSKWTIASINIFGDWSGDLVLPSELYFTDFFSIGATDNSTITVEDIKKVVISVENDNNIEVVNNVQVDSESGANSIEATGTPAGKKGDLVETGIESGENQGNANVKNFTNTNVFNGKWYLGMINTLGAWSGNIFSLPEKVAIGATPTGLSFFSSNSKDSDIAFQKFTETIADINRIDTTLIDIKNENDGKIVNNVDLSSLSGENRIVSDEVEQGKIFSGNTYALANILNFANTNLVNADLNIGMVNVFGKWDGNILFGFPDLTVSQKLSQDKFPKEKAQRVNYEVAYSNLGKSSMLGGSLEWHYDPAILKFEGVSDGFEYTENKPGILKFSLGKIVPQSSGKVNLQLKTLKNLPEGSLIQNYARIEGIGPERVKDNNEVLISTIAQTTLDPNNIPPNGPPNNPPQNPPNPPAENPTPPSTPPPAQQPSLTQPNPTPPPSQNPPPTGSPAASKAGWVKIFKSNDAAGRTIKPGDKVEFTLKVQNWGIDELYNVVVYDNLKSPNGATLLAKKFPLGKMAVGEEVLLIYELDAHSAAPQGRYTNAAYVEALSSLLKPVRSESTAISSFNLTNPPQTNPTAGNEKLNNKDEQNQNETKQTAEQDNPEIERSNDQVKEDKVKEIILPPLTTSGVKGIRISKKEPNSNPVPAPFDKIALDAEAGIVEEFLIPEYGSEHESRNTNRDQLIIIIIISSLMGFGYAIANLVTRLRRKT